MKMVCEGGCGAKDKLLFKWTGNVMVEGRYANKMVYMCADCIKMNEAIGKEIDGQVEEHNKEYVVKYKIRNKDGQEIMCELEHMTLTDFEEFYGTITDEILWLTVRKHGHAII